MTQAMSIADLDPSAFQRARAIFESALDSPAADRARLIDEACDRLARFEREAQVLAALNHVNIAAIYGVAEHPGRYFEHQRTLLRSMNAQRVAVCAFGVSSSVLASTGPRG
jgi:hypothetical protein